MSVCLSVMTVYGPVRVELGGSVRTTEDPSGLVNVSTFEADAGGVENMLVVSVGTGGIVSVCPSVITVCGPVRVEPGSSVRTTEDPSGLVNVLTFEANAGGVENTLDVIDIGSTVNVEPDIVRVLGPVTE